MGGIGEVQKHAQPEMDPVVQDFLRGIEPVRPEIRRLILFGSKARGEARFDSDYDILVVVPTREARLMDALYEAVLDVLLTHGRLISLKVFPEAEYNHLMGMRTPFTSRVAAEGRSLG